MQNLFNYDSKFMQFLLKFADYIILNLVYIACCVPIFTIGAAQAGLYNGLKVLQDKEDDSSCVKAFFRGFTNGFGMITILWVISAIVIALLGYNTLALYAYVNADIPGSAVPFWMCVVAVSLCVIYQSMLPLFHSRFGCTVMQLLKNTVFVIMANPFHSIAVTILLWAPVILIPIDYALFTYASVILLFLYYSSMLGFSVKIMSKPFKRLTDNFNGQSN